MKNHCIPPQKWQTYFRSAESPYFGGCRRGYQSLKDWKHLKIPSSEIERLWRKFGLPEDSLMQIINISKGKTVIGRMTTFEKS